MITRDVAHSFHHRGFDSSLMLKHQPKTLARTLVYIAVHSPDEFGLYWDSDGSMPWKEFYWALQEDDSLKFVRESNLRELALLGIDLPFILDGNRLRLRSREPATDYPLVDNIPERLYLAVRTKNLAYIQEFGLKSLTRPLMPVCAEREMALRIAKRRESEPVMIEIMGRKALDSGISIYRVGEKLFLVDAVPPGFLILPKIREEQSAAIADKKQKPAKKAAPVSPGSFVVQVDHVQYGAGLQAKKRKGKKEKAGWKTESRKDRHKRNI
jgi:putative RNA 2'-phosphotransferase